MSVPSMSRSSIDRRFQWVLGVIYAIVLCLLAWQLFHRWEAYTTARQAVAQARQLDAGLAVFDAIVDEREPVILLLEGALPPAPVQRELEARRQTTDHRLSALRPFLAPDRCDTCALLRQHLANAEVALNDARRQVDVLVSTPVAERSADAVADSIRKLAKVPLHVTPIDQTSAVAIMDADRSAQGMLYMAGFAANLRREAGLLESQLSPALISRRPLSAEEDHRIQRMLGGLVFLQEMLITAARGLPRLSDPVVAAVQVRFFQEMPAFVDKTMATLQQDPRNAVTVSVFHSRFHGYLQSVYSLRDESMALVRGDLTAKLERERHALAGFLVIALLLTAALLMAAMMFHRTIVRPFVEAGRYILALAAGKLDATPTRHRYHGEIAELFRSLDVLKDDLVQRLALQKERGQLIADLRSMAETDPLTGLYNRRAFLSLSAGLLRRSVPPSTIVLVMFDIDHFKRINDTYGHETGDVALKRLAELCRETWREEDVVARVGGEEFAVLSCVASEDHVTESAQRLMDALRADHQTAVDGTRFAMTVSFGVTYLDAGALEELGLRDMLREADRLMYEAKEGGRNRMEVARFVPGNQAATTALE
ncbi:GGDEF domain-containing protein [Dyella terrae]|uniref:diguanylate cyclase n=2 Tax=Dyella TaxID=231454 RepID=A0A4V6NA17_9GAMM|nr:GGDEF domain-containing protein [Dyella terrae]TBR39681.1 GGDEF domain-containing protein [Dyella terrae]TCI12737.1 GGDEF domain-containing protein [Dyella soli]